MRRFFSARPDLVAPYTWNNNRFVFFKETAGGPYGSINVPVTPFYSIATDKEVFPRACLAFMQTRIPASTTPGSERNLALGETQTVRYASDTRPAGRAAPVRPAAGPGATGAPPTRPYAGFALDHDTGGAIRAAGRCDIYMGIGPQAEALAGHTGAEGRLYYIFLKESSVASR
jgi:membrane-bound lytic murein transglycosylase A